MPKRIKKEDIAVEYVYAEPNTEAERIDAEQRVNRVFDIIFNHLHKKYLEKKRSENHGAETIK